MHTDGRYRRKQFSSCDACRKSRVACDALRRSARGLAACTRCASRGRHCSFDWMRRIPRGSEDPSERWNEMSSPPSIRSAGQRADSHDFDETSLASMRMPSLGTDVADWLQTMYEDGFEARGCLEDSPREHPTLSLAVSISSLCRQFDQLMMDLEAQGSHGPISQRLTQAEIDKERQIDHTLNQAIKTFSARWLPLTFDSSSHKEAQTQLIQSLWRDLRRKLPKAMNRPCYRSMLSLYLFSMVPVPVGISEEEEENGIPAQVCVQAALQQVQYLRARQRSLEFNGSKVSLLSDQAAVISTPDRMRTDFMTMENMIYWAALTFETSSSLTLNTKSQLSSGLLGWELEASWRMVKTCTDIFHDQSENWRSHGVMVTEETANQIIAAAQAFKLRLWKVGAILKEALREGHAEKAVQHAYTCAVDTINQFNFTYRPLLAMCERRLQFLGQHTKLRWYELMLHHNLCILIITDAIEIARRIDILDRMTSIRSEAEGSLMNCLKFGLSNQFTIAQRHGESQGSNRTFPLIAIDPYPHHVVAGVQLLWKGIERDVDGGNLEAGICEGLQSILLQTLELLPQTSKSIRKATEQARLTLNPHEYDRVVLL
ncbi:hypothetical protein N7510_010165 [Penicillium lagena]|uniref:uncharacterized protein n=1 Tax=Penicillium lagena TaxID=94218 RepID=UPI0025405B7A|nr:uncharacterized protein N7510_010165 [Penicillium lagena]KAJ5605011.1 hypothetical protein N7510_010165 [Penicillium lagena]